MLYVVDRQDTQQWQIVFLLEGRQNLVFEQVGDGDQRLAQPLRSDDKTCPVTIP